MIKFEQLKKNPEIEIFLQTADQNFAAIGYKEHGFRHAMTSALVSGEILKSLNYPPRDIELAKIAGYLHDIGNSMGENDHPQTGGVLALNILRKIGMPYTEIFKITIAIGSHEDRKTNPPNHICAALILGDKSDVHRMRVRKTDLKTFDTHDRVNYSTTESVVSVDPNKKLITLNLKIDTNFCNVMEHFEIFTSRMKLCKKAASFLKCNFELFINNDKML